MTLPTLRPDLSNERILEHLLLSLFDDPHDLRRIIIEIFGREIAATIAWEQPLSHIVRSIIDRLAARRNGGPDFFAALRAERSMCIPEIEAAEAAWMRAYHTLTPPPLAPRGRRWHSLFAPLVVGAGFGVLLPSTAPQPTAQVQSVQPSPLTHFPLSSQSTTDAPPEREVSHQEVAESKPTGLRRAKSAPAQLTKSSALDRLATNMRQLTQCKTDYEHAFGEELKRGDFQVTLQIVGRRQVIASVPVEQRGIHWQCFRTSIESTFSSKPWIDTAPASAVTFDLVDAFPPLPSSNR